MARIARHRWLLPGSCTVALLLVVACYANRPQRREVTKQTARPSARANPVVASRPPAAAPVPMAADAVGLHVALGVGDKEPTPWKGRLTLSAGKVENIEFWRPGQRWSVEGNAFVARTRRQGQNGPLIPPELFVTLSAPGADVQVTLETNHGKARFALSDVKNTEALAVLDGRGSVRRIPPGTKITPSGTDDDFPAAAAAPDGKVWLAYVSYQSGTPLDLEAIEQNQFDSMITQNNGDRVMLSAYDGAAWTAAMEVTGGLNDVWRPTVAVDGKGQVWVAWSQNVEDNWDLYRRKWDPQRGSWSEIERVTRDSGADINVVSARDAEGNVWWAWQAWRDDNFDILLSSTASDGAPVVVADSEGNEWNPAMAADGRGNVYVGWDSYGSGNYDVFVRAFSASRDAEPAIPVGQTARYEARVSLACDAGDRLWIAYEVGDVNWGKDYANATPQRIPIENLGNALYITRTVRVKCLSEDRLLVPQGNLAASFGKQLNRNKSFPRVGVDGAGNVWLLFRHHPLAGGGSENWASYATYYDGSRWEAAQFLPTSDYLLDDRVACAPASKGAGLVAVYTSDARLRGGGPNLGATRFAPAEGDRDRDLYATVLSAESEGGDPRFEPDKPDDVDAPVVHPEENEAVVRMRGYRIEHAGRTYQFLRGEFHRHTEFTAHRDQDGGFEEMWRYALDAADMDWIGNGDHDNGWGREYPWWIIQKVTDIFHHAPHFVPPFTYERSNIYPNGHRNVMFARRGIRTLPRTELLGTPEEGTPDTKHLYAYLRHFGGICAVHTSGTGMGTDWRDNDPLVEPVVEIYQGHRHNYEHFGAPRGPTQQTNIGGYEPAGFVWNALAKGYRLGFQSSSDHVSTHISYAVVLAEERSRQAIVDAFRKRHSYAATDNIVLDVRSGEHLMGDEFTRAANDPIALAVKVIGTRPIRRVDIVKNNGYMYVHRPERTAETEFTWKEVGPANRRRGTTSYYYVRVEQIDGQLAWSSPIWVRYE